MKGLLPAILLLGVCCLEGAVVEARPQGEEQTRTADIGAALQEYTKTLTQYFNTEMVDQLRTHAQTFADQFQSNLKPLTDQMSESFTHLLQTMKESVMKSTTAKKKKKKKPWLEQADGFRNLSGGNKGKADLVLHLWGECCLFLLVSGI
ncbi:hypothetical protein JRQ81_009409 [Phrynocephalus forsythii]|uniref:Apolipoprotein A-II n=1 Tax=Phrynocephalus forsythii TaxID=171643 RepID=A0A9Q0XBN2_9SAUR|nr:hypothetical protein JRQ81_009409 [Phrynocephalus forsythii]